MTYADIRNSYQANQEKARLGSHAQYAILSFPEAIEQATDTMDLKSDGSRSKDKHKRYSHVTLNRCRKALLKAAQRLEKISNFDLLLAEINRVIDDAGITGVAELGRYDFAVKIGAVLQLAPTDRIYVHRMPLRVARAMRLRIYRSTEGSTYVLRSDLPLAFKKMPADSIENMFCIWSSELIELAAAQF
jgi:hypothetical protein